MWPTFPATRDPSLALLSQKTVKSTGLKSFCQILDRATVEEHNFFLCTYILVHFDGIYLNLYRAIVFLLKI